MAQLRVGISEAQPANYNLFLCDRIPPIRLTTVANANEIQSPRVFPATVRGFRPLRLGAAAVACTWELLALCLALPACTRVNNRWPHLVLSQTKSPVPHRHDRAR